MEGASHGGSSSSGDSIVIKGMGKMSSSSTGSVAFRISRTDQLDPPKSFSLFSFNNMAWRCSGSTNQELLNNMRSAELIKSNMVWQAMSRVDRANYVSTSVRRDAYSDAPQPIGYGATISAPHMHAHAAEAMLPFLKKGNKVLDVGSGSGYTMAIFWHLVKQDDQTLQNQVVGIDHIPQLVHMADGNLRRDGLATMLDKRWMHVVTGDGRLGAFS